MNTNKTHILSLAIFPPIAWFATFVQKKTIIEIHETFYKQTYRNRYSILSANGALDLSVPIHKPYGHHSKTTDIKILYETEWQQQHKNSLIAAYKSSPYFEFFTDDIFNVLNSEHNSLYELSIASINACLKIMKIRAEINKTSSYIHQYDVNEYVDLRNYINPKNKEYKKNINSPPYKQVFSEKYNFVDNLSVLDLIMNLGLDSIEYLRKYTDENLDRITGLTR